MQDVSKNKKIFQKINECFKIQNLFSDLEFESEHTALIFRLAFLKNLTQLLRLTKNNKVLFKKVLEYKMEVM